ncbi:MAG: phospholipid-binding lipoprotein MlaA [Paracoccaceae bacterium]
MFKLLSKSRIMTPSFVLMLLLASCGPAEVPTSDLIYDPNEIDNREVHEVNLAIDRAFVRPASTAYGTIVPEPIRQGIGNAASNLNQPGHVVNNILQLRIGAAAQNTLRFAINSTIGIAGIFDPATAMGVTERSTDFGETLHLWGVGEGEFVELPVVGPSTQRDFAGLIVDTALNPLRYVFDTPELDYANGVNITSRFGDRYRYSDFIDSIFYQSEDGYAQARSLYLQNRRFKLRGDAEPEYFDPYEDPYAE